jgi:hypothetical protein
MPDAPTLRRTERDLYAAADEMRAEEIPDVEARRDDLLESLTAEYDDVADVPAEDQARYEQLNQRLEELHGTANTYEHYADEWADGDECLFVLEELNGDEWAATVDAVSREAAQQAGAGAVPEGHGRVKALEYGVTTLPGDAPADPGKWPAPVVNELYDALESITAPRGVELGNSSLADAMTDTDEETTVPAGQS